MSTPASPFFMSYSREDVSYQKRVIAELRQRGISVWVDTENLIPGSPSWEREIERAIRAAAGSIVLLSPFTAIINLAGAIRSYTNRREKRRRTVSL